MILILEILKILVYKNFIVISKLMHWINKLSKKKKIQFYQIIRAFKNLLIFPKWFKKLLMLKFNNKCQMLYENLSEVILRRNKRNKSKIYTNQQRINLNVLLQNLKTSKKNKIKCKNLKWTYKKQTKLRKKANSAKKIQKNK